MGACRCPSGNDISSFCLNMVFCNTNWCSGWRLSRLFMREDGKMKRRDRAYIIVESLIYFFIFSFLVVFGLFFKAYYWHYFFIATLGSAIALWIHEWKQMMKVKAVRH